MTETINGSEELLDNCDPCKLLKKDSVAISYCTECEENLCEICTESHVSRRATKTHKPISLQEKENLLKKTCSPCGEKNTEAKSFCEECEEYLCSACTEEHLKRKATKNHGLVEIASLPERMAEANVADRFCRICTITGLRKNAEMFCVECKELLCPRCTTLHNNSKATSTHHVVEYAELETVNKDVQKSCEPCILSGTNKLAEKYCEECTEYLCKECGDRPSIQKATSSHSLRNACESLIEVQLCDVCIKVNEVNPAVLFCQECEEKLCEKCRQSHKNQRATKNHTLIPLNEKPTSDKSEHGSEECDLCQKADISKPATHFCEMCELFFCDSCTNKHRRQRVTKEHILRDVATVKLSHTHFCGPCQTVNDETIAKMHCLDCSENLCDECTTLHKVQKQSKGHTIVNVAEALKHDTKHCEPCKEQKKISRAIKYCTICEEYLCNDCCRFHSRYKQTRDHQLKDIEEFKMENKCNCDPCNLSDKKEVEAQTFCKECEEFLCSSCASRHKAEKLSRNHVFLSVAEGRAQIQNNTFFCNPCTCLDKSTKAFAFCEECQELLCDLCIKHHSSQKISRGHKISTDLSNYNSEDVVGVPKSRDNNDKEIERTQTNTEEDKKTKMMTDIPGKPTSINIYADNITLVWEKPIKFEDKKDYYQVSYKEADIEKWNIFPGEHERARATITDLKADTKYVFRVRVVHTHGEGNYGEESEVIKTVVSTAAKLVGFSTIVEIGNPSVYAVPITEVKSGRNTQNKTKKFEVGSRRPDIHKEKTIMLVGATGTGKSTLVNGIVNYALGVNWSDHFRFTIINLEDEEKADESDQDDKKLLKETPEISKCFEDTVLVWVPYGYLWVVLVPYLIYLSKWDNDPPLPWSRLMITKTILTVVLFCLVIADALLTKGTGYKCLSGGDVPVALYIADGLKAGTFILVLILEQYMRILGVRTSGVPFVFWLLITVADIIPLYSIASAGVWCATSTVFCIKFACTCVQLLLRCFADHYKNRGYHGLDPDPCPEESASVLNKITFSWITSLVVQAYKQTLTRNDLWTQTRRLQSRRVVGNFLKNWNALKHAARKVKKDNPQTYSRYSIPNETRSNYHTEKTPLLANGYGDEHTVNSIAFGTVPAYVDNHNGPSIFKVLIKSFGWLWIEACGYKIIGDAVNLLQPVILRYIIDVIERKDDADAYPVWLGYTYAVALFATSMIKSLVWQTCLQNMICLGLTIKTALIGAVYRKALTLSNSAKKTSTVGEIVNLMSVDCQRVQDAFTFSHHILSLPFVTVVAMVQLWMLMGVAMFGGLAVVLVAVVINGILGRMQQRLQRQILGFKSKRIKILNEVINGIKVLKMYTWELPFQNKVSSIRREEISRLWKYAILTAVAILFSIHSPFMVNYMLVLVYTLVQSVHYLDAQTAFVALSLVNILRGPITLTPFIINGVIQGYVSLSRIQAFLWKEDINDDNVSITGSGEYMINIDDGTFSWERKDLKPTLKGIDLKIREGQIYAVVGQVGCGKSSLIAAILGEMEKLRGTVEVKGKLAYVPQEAWIQNMTVRDNIIFGNEWNLDRYNKVLTGCAMIQDLEMLSGGDMTEIGEKGINISGGQKQRVSLARAVYSDADVYLLDDPLSAVDSHVGKHLFKNVIGPQGLLKRKTRILVTHGIHWLPMVDKILVITGGHISETGTYEELISRNGPFANLVQTYLENGEESDGDDTEGSVTTATNVALDDSVQDKSATRSLISRRRHKSSEREKSFGMSFTKQHGSEKDMKRNDQLMSRLVQEEQSQKGAVQFAVFQKYAKSMGYIALLFTMLFMVGFQSMNVFSNYWLTYWTEDRLMKNVSLGHTSEYEEKYAYYLVCYTIIGVIQGIAIFAFGALGLTRMVRASGILHNSMLECILRSPMSFFDTTPVGRIMNRFSSDIDVMDDRLPLNFRLWNIQIFSTVATIIVVSINTPIFLVVIVPVTIVYLMLLKFFLPTARQVKRLESVLRSPIYNHFSETITGVGVIRAYKCMDRFIEESEKRIDTNIKFFFAATSASRWIAIRLETLGNILILAAAVFALLSTGLNGAQVGLSITYALQITISLNLVIQAVSEMEMNIVSAERVKEYTELHPEAPWTIKSRRPSVDWPRTGAIEFRLFRTRYREGLELTLKGISCQIRSGEKIGIVGRTGAGKSSLALSLFRLIESAGGAIIIDGRNIADMGLHDLRNKLTILPQDPVLFSGSLRENLDPFGKYDEHSLWKALECAHLKNAVDNMPGQLEYECGEGGSNLSVGQRQLVCLARTLLHKTKILILDEATAAVDLETDELIQATIRTEFSDCTILTIAHRLNTVLDYDRVLVLSEGKILELDQPSKLLQDSNSVFFKMAKDAGLVS